MRRTKLIITCSTLVTLGTISACGEWKRITSHRSSGPHSSTAGDSGTGTPNPAPPGVPSAAPVPATSYVAKVKNLLLGLAATDAEIADVTADSNHLAALITQWQSQPQYESKMLGFFGNAFQQSQAQEVDFNEQGALIRNNTSVQNASLLANLRESFARTAWDTVKAGRSFTDLMTTNTFMMTPPLMAYYALLDQNFLTDTSPDRGTVMSLSSYSAADFNAWNHVTITQPTAGQATTAYNPSAPIPSTGSMVLNVPRYGFYTTPAFFAQWQTNASNQFRVTINQTMIAGVGKALDGTDPTVPQSLTSLDAAHAPPGTECHSCHVTLDPMRQYFRQAYSFYYHQQTNPAQTSVPGMWAFAGVSTVGKGIADLGGQIAASPAFAAAWTQKLCTYANSAPCATTDPEFQRISQAFASSSFNWNNLVTTLFSSPIVTNATVTPTQTASGGVVSLARRDHLCALLSNRLGITDLCGLSPTTSLPAALKAVPGIAEGLPSDAYARGAVNPVLVAKPDLFFFGGIRNLCQTVANGVVDSGAPSKYVSTDTAAAITDFSTNLMGLSGERASTAHNILQGHYTVAKQAGLSNTNALKSTFVLACSAPSTISIGE